MPDKPVELDEIDKKIIEILQKDARTSFSKIAKMLDRSEATIHLRVKKLREMGVLRGFYADIDASKIGKDTIAFILIKIDANKYPETVKDIVKLEDIYEAYDVTGEYSLLVKTVVRDREELARLLDLIGKMEGVQETYTMYVLRVLKEVKSVRVD
ncbi:Lrp/AsnC family transcriptional regulator [Ignicoccus hospitalis]|uniref:Transcriptional regulator, AsnC family n=1 Tax=Ignicoccus hospitalis (strain KIN4/I / DSM 18386 / JCM 14125) TaxID=453591 RepID=A8AAD6_IGNH4|nr:Lrp/AsnC family transcriptional regulator [Ignicoccus hospitalis]ABU81888.1 transcriptional regulator, AsnC family [Ignicoccus hospitalis KIN4/I]